MIRARPVPALAAWLALWFAALALPATAQTVPVRSGAHDGFDRLVLDMPGRRSWRVVPRESGASVIFESAGLRFDLGAVFDRIGRQRLRAISASGDGVRLDLAFACDCRIAPFWHAGDMLVIDIADAPADTASAPTARPRPWPLAGPESATPDVPALGRPSSAGAALAARLDARTGPRITALPDAGAAPPADRLDTMRAALGQQLGRAASQGLVTPATGGQGRDAASLAPPPGPPGAPPAAAADRSGTREGRTAAPGLRISTSMDRDTAAPPRPAHGERACPPVAHLDVAGWGSARPFAFEVGRLNGALFGEFDTVRGAEALRLARLYIHHGFGAEARQVLDWLDADVPEIARARNLSRLVEGRALPTGAALAAALGCGEPGVLWAILAMPELQEESVFDHRALRRSFVALPGGLRRALGPGLVQRLVAAGHRETADAILRHLRGSDALSNAETGLAIAALATETGEDAAAEEALRAVARTNAEQTGVALAETIERALAREAPVDFDDAELAGALAFEHRGTPLGGRLALAYVSALAASGAFGEAIDEFRRLRSSVPDAEVARVASVLAKYLERQAGDVTFLRVMMTDKLLSPGALEGDVASDVARRLLALGFPAEAARHVARAPRARPGADGTARHVLRARIALAQERPAAALSELLGLEGAEADLLRAAALAARGNHAAARRLFAARDAARRADRAALHTGRAEMLAETADTSLREVGDILARDAAAPAAGGGAEIASHRELLERSTALRGVMARLLAATPAQAAKR